MCRLVLYLLFIPCLVYGQAEYYRSVEGLKKAELKTALHDLIQPDQVLKYGGKGEGYTWAGFYDADWLEGGYVRDRYSDELRLFNADKSAVANMNIEHIWANSWWGHIVNNAYCDLFNLYPADGPANGRKSNNPIGIVDGAVAYDNGVIKVGKSSSYRADSLITAWEPADEWKGDFARTYFYMATCYQHYTDLWTTTEGWLTVDGSEWPTMRPWVYNLMLAWAKEDPVDEIEQNRNEVIQTFQGNRNPFVDYPQLCEYIWGDSTDYRFYIDPTSTQTELFVPAANANIDYGLQALSKGYQTTLVLRGRNIAGGLDVSVDNADFQLGATHIGAADLEVGYALPISISPSAAGSYATQLSITGGGFSQVNTLSVSFVDGIPAYAATDIVCSVSSRRFTANWMAYEDGATYTLDVYTKDAVGTHVPYGSYTTTGNSYQVSGVKANTTYYYTVSIYDGGTLVASSNEVAIQMPEVDPVFSVSPYSISFSATPGNASKSVAVSITALSIPEYVMNISLDAPFEVSADGDDWTQNLTVTGSSPSFFVRLGSVEEEGDYEGEMVVTTKGVDEKIVTLTASVDAKKAFYEDFEQGSKGGYAEGTVDCSATTWKMTDALIGADDNAHGSKCVRFRNKGSIEMQADKSNGCDSLWFYAGLYGKDTGVKLSAYYSTDGGTNWTPVVQDLAVSTMQRYGYKLDVKGDIRLKFVNNGSSNSKRINLDDVQMSDYGQSNGIESIDGDERRATGNDALYDLSGRRATQKSRIIIDASGRKVISYP